MYTFLYMNIQKGKIKGGMRCFFDYFFFRSQNIFIAKAEKQEEHQLTENINEVNTLA